MRWPRPALLPRRRFVPFTGSSQMMLTTQARSGSFSCRRARLRHLGLPQGEPLFDEGESYKDIYADYLMERYYPEDGGDR